MRVVDAMLPWLTAWLLTKLFSFLKLSMVNIFSMSFIDLEKISFSSLSLFDDLLELEAVYKDDDSIEADRERFITICLNFGTL